MRSFVFDFVQGHDYKREFKVEEFCKYCFCLDVLFCMLFQYVHACMGTCVCVCVYVCLHVHACICAVMTKSFLEIVCKIYVHAGACFEY